MKQWTETTKNGETWWTCNHCGRTGCNPQWKHDHTGHCSGDKSWQREAEKAKEMARNRRWI